MIINENYVIKWQRISYPFKHIIVEHLSSVV